MKKILVIAAVFVIVALSLVSCAAGDGAPKGMIDATAKGEPFKLYVPEDLTSNAQSGISSAYAFVPNKLVITARYFTPTEEMTLTSYVREYCAKGYEETMKDFVADWVGASVLAEKNAEKMVFKATIDEIPYVCTQLSVLNNGDIVSLIFYVPEESVAACESVITKTVDAFVLCEKTEDAGNVVTDKKTPSGMKIASDNKIEYRFYVPDSWVCDSESGKSEAYYPESGRSNVTVTSYSTNLIDTVQDYVDFCKKTYEEELDGYKLIEEGTAVMASRDASFITYSVTYDNTEYKIKQISIKNGGLFYTITYTALSDNFALHTDDVDRMAQAFIFR